VRSIRHLRSSVVEEYVQIVSCATVDSAWRQEVFSHLYRRAGMQLYTFRKLFYCRWIRYIKRIDNKTCFHKVGKMGRDSWKKGKEGRGMGGGGREEGAKRYELERGIEAMREEEGGERSREENGEKKRMEEE